MGNLRQDFHPYHSKLLWRENRQLADCRANDVICALKSYLRFVCDANTDDDAFNIEFFKGKQPLSWLFWSVAAPLHLSAAQLITTSAAE